MIAYKWWNDGWNSWGMINGENLRFGYESEQTPRYVVVIKLSSWYMNIYINTLKYKEEIQMYI